MICIIYISCSVEPFGDAELDRLLEASRRNNHALGLTGLLLYRDGDFMQILEGEEDAVRRVYARVLADPRHQHVVMLDESPIIKRSFGEWSMGFRRLSDSDAPDGFVDFMSEAFDSSKMADHSSRALKFMLHFKQLGQ